MIIISCFLVGLSVYEKYYRRTVFLQNYINLMVHIKNEINYTQNPIQNIISRYRKSSYLKQHIEKLLQNLKTNSLEHSWYKTFNNISKENGLSIEEENIISGFGKELGIGDLETQSNIINHHLKILETHLKEACEVRKSKGNLPIILALGFGLFIAIIFI